MYLCILGKMFILHILFYCVFLLLKKACEEPILFL